MMDARHIENDQDLEILRQIRNSGRQWMTRDTREITHEQQQAWWKDTCHDPSLDVWLFSEALTTIGYGLLRIEGGREWCSLAVLPRYQRQGYGTQIYRWLALTTSQDVWAEILADNTPSIRAALKAGYQIVSAMDKHAVLVHRK